MRGCLLDVKWIYFTKPAGTSDFVTQFLTDFRSRYQIEGLDTIDCKVILRYAVTLWYFR